LFVGVLALPRVFVSLAVGDQQVVGDWIKTAAFALFTLALAYVGATRPTKKPTPKHWFYGNAGFQVFCLLPLCLFAAAVAIGHAWFDLKKYNAEQHGLLKMMLAGAVFTAVSSLIYTIRKIIDEGSSVLGK